MIQRRGSPRFLLEALQAFRIGGERGRQHFDGHVAAEPRVARAVDLAHPAGANEREDIVGAEASAGSQGHGCGIRGL